MIWEFALRQYLRCANRLFITLFMNYSVLIPPQTKNIIYISSEGEMIEDAIMTLYKRILFGVVFICLILIGLILINTQLILVDSYQRLEAQNATQNVDRVLHVLQ